MPILLTNSFKFRGAKIFSSISKVSEPLLLARFSSTNVDFVSSRYLVFYNFRVFYALKIIQVCNLGKVIQLTSSLTISSFLFRIGSIGSTEKLISNADLWIACSLPLLHIIIRRLLGDCRFISRKVRRRHFTRFLVPRDLLELILFYV